MVVLLAGVNRRRGEAEGRGPGGSSFAAGVVRKLELASMSCELPWSMAVKKMPKYTTS